MKNIEQIMEQFVGHSILSELADTLRECCADFVADEQHYLEAVDILRKMLPQATTPTLDEYLAAKETDARSRLVYAGANGLRANIANFQHPFTLDFTRMDFFDIVKDHIIGHFPINYETATVCDRFCHTLPEELREYESIISEYFTHFECAGPKLAHYAGYVIGNKLLPWVIPGYREDWHQTMLYESEIKSYLGKAPF